MLPIPHSSGPPTSPHLPHLSVYIYSPSPSSTLPSPPHRASSPAALFPPPHAIMCNTKLCGRPVLQPAGNRVSAAGELNDSMKKPLPPPPAPEKLSPSPFPPSQAVLKRGSDPNGLNSSGEKPPTPRSTASRPPMVVRKKSKKAAAAGQLASEPGVLPEAPPGSIAAEQREKATLMQQQRRMRIAHYGRTAAGKLGSKGVAVDSATNAAVNQHGEKRCSFVTPNSDPLYVAYHDEEWGVPVHDDK